MKGFLLVDDDQITNYLNKSVIEKYNFAKEIIIKTNGWDALNYLEVDCMEKKKYPNLVILDLNMPGMDGFEFLFEFERICKSVRTDTVVVVLTTSRNPDDILRLRQIGSYDILPKPLTANKLESIYIRYFKFLDMA